MILVTGGTGLLGAHLLLELTRHGHHVKALRREGSGLHVMESVFATANDHASLQSMIEWVEGDILDVESLIMAMADVEQVYHCAALVSFAAEDKKRLMQINVEGTANMVNAALITGIRHFVYVSSIATLGSSINGEPVSEGAPWDTLPKGSVYGLSKHAAEREVWRAMAEGLQAVIINPSVILGPGDWSKGSSELFTAVWNGLKYTTTGVNGYVDVRDVARAMVGLANARVVNERFVVNGANVSYKDLFEAIAQGLGKPAPKKIASPVAGELAWRLFAVLSLFTGKKPLITKETARAAQKRYSYSSQSLIQQIGFTFTPFRETISYVSNRFLIENHQ
ncbi:MAG: hypothetical protein A2X11_09430 [Bacteroidetes bacterium GWE2_42_24]|nr:MAG: hypothetical protein A2X11_09430 [Bacteroidetes bacterium GWE2_42_24]OFY25772.1 MAG: hypothetical protein A2X09_09320 [Bacteroidetes bacterium GWF2_43_11]